MSKLDALREFNIKQLELRCIIKENELIKHRLSSFRQAQAEKDELINKQKLTIINERRRRANENAAKRVEFQKIETRRNESLIQLAARQEALDQQLLNRLRLKPQRSIFKSKR
ncbi:hypothetical protein P9112_012155 [Eukaryota sp. TZLM1-RC]